MKSKLYKKLRESKKTKTKQKHELKKYLLVCNSLAGFSKETK